MITAEEKKPKVFHLRQDVEEELAREPTLNATTIGIALEDGVVTLSGNVASHAEKIAAERAAERVRGVRAIVSHLKVDVPKSVQPADAEIARAAVHTLSWNALVPADRVKVEVESGWLTLQGEVDWRYQKKAAYDAVCNLRGVKGVSDNVSIKPATIPAPTKAHIEAALRRRFGARMGHVAVETRGDHVTLRGTVNSLAERTEIEQAAWTTPGVCQVNNNLSVAKSKPRRVRVRSMASRRAQEE